MTFKPTDPEWQRFVAQLKSFPREEIIRRNQEQHEKSERLYKDFKECFSKGTCDSCGKPLRTFTQAHPCFHWLLRPKGVKKEHVGLLFQSKGYYRPAAYIRWVANAEVLLARINDLQEEGNNNAVFHWSATYKHIKWTFWCTKNDYLGHEGTPHSHPHFHVEIRLNGQVFVKFNDFHIPFSDEDLFNLKCELDENMPLKQSFGPFGSGMKDAFELRPEQILKLSKTTDDESKAVYHIQTVATSNPGMSIEHITELIRKSKQTGKPIASFLSEAGLKTQIIISPADTIPNKETRTNTRKKGS